MNNLKNTFDIFWFPLKEQIDFSKLMHRRVLYEADWEVNMSIRFKMPQNN